MALRRRPPRARACELAVAAAMVAGPVTGCDPQIVDAFELPREPLGVVALTCPPGSLKAEPGSCGCDVPDEDFDADGTTDCLEACPDNAGRLVPTGPCGCSSFADALRCDELRGALRHLYTFDGRGTEVLDSRGDAHGSIEHVDEPPLPLDMLQLNGRLTLDGQGSYVALPDRLMSSLGDATFEAWLTWRGDGFWSRIFDFGDNGGTPVDGVTYLFLTPLNSTTGTLRVAYSVAGPTEETVADGAAAFPIHSAPDNTPDHVAVVIDRTNRTMRLHFNGLQVGSQNQAIDLAALNDVNNWLGRSNFAVDPPLSAALVEFRIYQQALTPAQIAASFQAGPGALD